VREGSGELDQPKSLYWIYIQARRDATSDKNKKRKPAAPESESKPPKTQSRKRRQD